jgi:8-amino-7-oxononanoate synthase
MTLHDDAAAALAALGAMSRLRRRRVLGTVDGGARIDGAEVHNFSSNDYLGLAGDGRLQRAAVEAMGEDGFGATSSRLIHTHRAHNDLEGQLAAWLGREKAQLFNSGYAANVGVLSTVAGAGDVIFSDELNHASIIDGCRLSRARVVVYRHGDLEDLRRRLSGEEGRRRFVISETVFSMDGDIVDVVGLAAIAREAEAALILDEAHAIGVRGPGGRGVAAEHGVVPDVLVGTLGKAFGGVGAFAASSAAVADWLWNRARSLVFSTGLPPSASAAASAALEIIQSGEGEALRARVEENGRFVRGALGLGVGSHIVPWLVGDDEGALRRSGWLLERGLFVQAIRPPTVPEGTARLRIALGVHRGEVVAQLVEALRACGCT